MGTIREWQRKIHKLAIEKGWWTPSKRPIPELLCLIHAEVSEALEAYRSGDLGLFREECADVAIRLMDMCEGLGIDLELEMNRKHGINEKRPYRHGGKRA